MRFSRIKVWITALRLPFTTITLLAVIFGTLLAINENRQTFKPLIFFLSLLGALLFHLGSNVINDYFDDKNGTDRINKDFIAPFCGGSRTIQNNQLSSKQMLWLSLILFTLAITIGVILALMRGWPVLIFGAIGLSLGVLYSAVLVRFFLGELSVGVAFGILLISGSYFMQSNTLDWRVVLYALPATFLTMLIIWINQYPDYRADKKSGKHNLVVRMGKKQAAYGYLLLTVLTYASLLLIGLKYNIYFIIPGATLLIAFWLAYKLIKNHHQIEKIGFTLPLTIALHHSVTLLSIGALLFTLASPTVGALFSGTVLAGSYLLYWKSTQHG